LRNIVGPVIRGFNGLRGIAVTMVVLTHLGITGFITGVIPGLSFIDGNSGVLIFFALSGFLITTLLRQEYNRTSTISLANFYLRRTLRIFPLYFLVLFLTYVVPHLIFHEISRRAIMVAMIYMTNFIPVAWYSSLVAHTWSLAVEEHFYLFWPITLSLLGFRWGRAVALLCAAIVCSATLFNILLSIPFLTSHFFIYRWTPIAGASIAFGCLCALLISTPRFQLVCEPIMASPLLLTISLVLFAHSMISSVFVAEPQAQQMWPTYVSSSLLGRLDFYLQAAGAALFISWVYLNQSSYIVKVLELPPLRYVGVISYGVYMWQGFFLATGPERAPGQLWPLSPILGVICLSIVAPLSFHFFEKPILGLKRRLMLINGRFTLRDVSVGS
jgi:peptidoglycan/LPS O-acetylase OafA/YrhL